MNSKEYIFQNYIDILKQELKPANGCTEPIAIAFAAAKAFSHFKKEVNKVSVEISRNILKNIKSVIVPNTFGLKGLEAAIAAGIIFGDASKEYEVINNTTLTNNQPLKDFIQKVNFAVKPIDSKFNFDLTLVLENFNECSTIRIIDNHTNIVYEKYNDQLIKNVSYEVEDISGLVTHNHLNIADIVDFASHVDLNSIRSLLDLQIECNIKIAEEGLKNNYGANIGKTILKCGDKSIKNTAKAYAAAASDARMNGCPMPVVINSGSGNQGLTSSIPVIIYARNLAKTKEELYRALLVANLTTIRIKTGIGRLSAYCGVIAAGAGAGAGVAYLLSGKLDAVCHTIVNSLAILSGTVCDGAKASCAAKIASSVDAGIFGFEMFENGNEFLAGDGLVKKGVEETIDNFTKLATEGMVNTDQTIINLMINEE